MLPRADLNANRPPAALEASTPSASSTDARLEVFQRLTQIAIGRELQATIQSQLDDGTYLVKVEDAAARMALPVGTRVGDTLSMVLIAKEPRATFLLTQQGSAPASLSLAARLINQLVQAREGEPAAVQAKAPLLSSLSSLSAMNAERIAVALRNAISSSGLFYESHLHDWISGSRPASDLANEPQAQLATSARHATAETRLAGEPELARLASNLRELGDGVHKLMSLMRDAQVQPANPLHTDADVIAPTQTALPALDPEAARLINLQLGALETQQIRWHGELWPGQQLEWEITEDQRDGSDGTAPEESSWTSTMHFRLPHLGEVSATVRLTGDHAQVQVGTANETTAESLRQHSSALANALEAAGTQLDSLLVKRKNAE